MKHIYNQNSINAFFSVQTIEQLRKDLPTNEPHKWFTCLIINKLESDIAIDEYLIKSSTPLVLFITPGQYLQFSEEAIIEGFAVSFNKEFYCIEYHDHEVSCNGLLFVNNFTVVQITLDKQQQIVYNNTVNEMAAEFGQEEFLLGEMLKNLLKNLLIRSNRLFKSQYFIDETDDSTADFARKYSELVEKNFRQTKQVEVYAEMMGVAPATLTKKLQKTGVESPSRIIKNRVITEAKRLLMYTDMSVKEIAHLVGYDDQHYFSRVFTNETQISPSNYKKTQNKKLM